ncbi:MAG: SoxR reducing system RseC family protein [Bacteroidota bacterium]
MAESFDCIVKSGIVDHIDDRKVYVRILSVSACATCHTKGICTSSEMSEKLIEVDRTDAPEVSSGQTVQVSLSAANGNLAVVFGYVIPFLILIIALIIFANFLSEGLAGLIAIATLVPYYSGLYLFRARLQRRFRFIIE